MKHLSRILLVGLLATAGASAAETQGTPHAERHKYLVVLQHDADSCLASLEAFAKAHEKLLSEIAWGCHHGDHRGYAIVDARSEQDALAKFPAAARAQATTRPVVMYGTMDELRQAHRSADQAASLQRQE